MFFSLRRYSRLRPVVVLSLIISVVTLSDATGHLLGLLRPTVRAATNFTVDSTGDAADSNLTDGVCNDGSGSCTLRAAIEQANALAGPDSINFNIGSGVKTIVLAVDLPIIADPVVIDGTTQPGFAGAPIIEVNSNNRSNTSRATLFITAGSSTIKGLVLNRSTNAAIAIATNGGNHIEGNFIGTDVTGSQRLPNKVGVIISTALNTVGGTTAAARNVISGNGVDGVNGGGIELDVAAIDNVIEGNYIGVNAAGTAIVWNTPEGIRVTGRGNRIGGTAPGSGNVISGNGWTGIFIGGQMTTVQGNLIGTNAAGTAPLPNGRGIIVSNSPNNVVGGTSAAARNVISGNFGVGLTIEEPGATGNVVQGNFIGTDVSGVAPLPNGANFGDSTGGIRIDRGSNNLIGGTAEGAANTIAYNARAGVSVSTLYNSLGGAGNRISRNSIYGNSGLGIDLGEDWVTANDSGDADADANHLQNFPVITAVNTVGGITTVAGTLASSPNTSYELEFFRNHGCHYSGNGEGAGFLMASTVTTDANGNAAFAVTLQSTLPPGQIVTATATDPSGNTSEFSPCDPNGATGVAQFETIDVRVREDLNTLTIPVKRVGGSNGTLTVNFATVDATAIAGQDYTAITGTLTFADGEISKTISLPILSDTVNDGGESLFVTLSNPVTPDVVGNSGTVVVTILDLSDGVAVSINPAIIMTEGNAGTTDAVATVRLSAAIGKTVTVNYQTVAGTATAGVDFQPVSGMLTFPPGVTTQTVSVPIIGDTIHENNEGFTFNLSNAVNASINNFGRFPPGVSILDDDPAPTISVNDVVVSEGASGTTNAVFTVSLSGATEVSSQAFFATLDGTATAGVDYQFVSGAVIFNPGETSKQVTVVVNGDVLNEPNETFFLNLTFAAGATFADSQGQGTIVNAVPSGGVIRFNSGNYSVAEAAGMKTITVERSGDTSQAVTVDYASGDHSNPAGLLPCTSAGAGLASSRCDFTTAIGTLRFAPGETTKTFNVLIINDNYTEGPETLSLTLSNPTGGAQFGAPQAATLSITDDAVEPATNQVDVSSEFVRSQYHDFLNREPDAPGLAFWTDNIEKCNDASRRPPGQTAAQCIDKQRESTAVAFFMSPEFQITGGFVYHLYKGSLTGSPNYDGGSPGSSAGRFPTSLEFMRDLSTVSEGIVVNNQISGAVVEANRNRLAAEFVQRPEFIAKYGGLNNTLYVQELLNTTGVSATPAEKQALVNGLTGGTETKASVLRKVVDGTVVISEGNVQFTTSYGQAFVNQENRRVFVFMEYVGYLRRNPDPAGFVFWLAKLNTYNGDPFQAEMVRSFILSPEYRQRFGQ